jgi:hypothetical protein
MASMFVRIMLMSSHGHLLIETGKIVLCKINEGLQLRYNNGKMLGFRFECCITSGMARPLRLEFAGAIYHLTSRGNARQRVFLVIPTDSYLCVLCQGWSVVTAGFATPTA